MYIINFYAPHIGMFLPGVVGTGTVLLLLCIMVLKTISPGCGVRAYLMLFLHLKTTCILYFSSYQQIAS